MSEPDLTMLALGTDLTGLGLNLNSPDPLYKVRGGGWATKQLMGRLVGWCCYIGAVFLAAGT
jgi:hypothetical protein